MKKQLREGKQIVLIANGDIMSVVLEASEQLEQIGISVRVLDMHTIKPLDETAVKKAIYEVGRIITVEDHTILNGLGSAVSEIVAQEGTGIVRRIGIPDCFGESAPYKELLEKMGITATHIVEAAKELVQKG